MLFQLPIYSILYINTYFFYPHNSGFLNIQIFLFF